MMMTSTSRVPPHTQNSRFILSVRLDFRMVSNLSIAFGALSVYMWTLFSVNEILPPRYMKWSVNFRGVCVYVCVLVL